MNTSPESLAHKNTPFRGNASWPQFRRIQRALLPWWANSYVTAAYMTFLMVSLGTGWGVALSSPVEAIGDLVVVGFLLAFVWGATFYLHKRAWKAQGALHGEITGTVGEQGIEWTTATMTSKFPWAKILKYKQLSDMTLTFYSPRCAFYFPRDFFSSDEDWRQFNDTVATHVKLPGT